MQYEEHEQASKLQQALAEMQISSTVQKIQSARGCKPTKKKVLADADPDAELTLKLLKITP